MRILERSAAAVVALAFVAGSVPAAGADLINVGPLGTATQSSQQDAYGPERAIDGSYDNGNFTHTAAGNDGLGPATWEVDLGEEYPIEQIVLHNRGDCCGERLRDITVSILDGVGDLLWESDLLNPADELFAPPEIELDLPDLIGEVVRGQIVRVTREPDPLSTGHDADVLSLREVEVLVDASAVGPVITTQPVGGDTYVGGCHVFEVAVLGVEGAASISYRWLLDGEEIEGATGPRLPVGPIVEDDAGVYTVEISVDGDELVSDPAELVVLGENLAIHGIAAQSSTAHGGPAARAIDGNTSSLWGDGSITHTADEDGAWWEVELSGESTVERIVLYNRSDCCAERLSNFRLSVLDPDRLEVWGEDFFTEVGSQADATVEVDLPADTVGRIVRVERLGPDPLGFNYLSLAEVEVFGEGPETPPELHPDLAQGCGVVTRQSTTSGAYTSDLAINGNKDDFTHTVVGNGGLGSPWWEIDLGEEHDIATIFLHNRTSCCGSRLRDITVTIHDANGDLVWESDLLNPENESFEYDDGPPVITIDLLEIEGDPVPGQIVRVTREPDLDLSGTDGQGNEGEPDILSLGEVEIFGVPEGCPDDGDTHCAGLTVEGPPDDYPGAYVATAEATDDSEDTIYYTFRVEGDGEEPTRVIGPQESNVATFALTAGAWTVSVSVDDDPLCPDEAEDAGCETDLVVLDVENLAPFGVATQSSEWNGGIYPASLGIDGNLDNFTHTAAGNDGLGAATWEVDLLSEQAIGRVVLFNRTSCCGSRLRDITVTILDGLGDPVWESDPLNPENELGEYPLGPPFLVVDLEAEEGEGGVTGQIVRVTREPDPDLSGTGGQGDQTEMDALSLAEVQVYEPTGIVVHDDRFVRADADANGTINITDGIFILNFLFLGGPTPPCRDAADSDDSGAINITDGIYVLNFLFLGGPDPAPPHPGCGTDPDGEEDGLDCLEPHADCIP